MMQYDDDEPDAPRIGGFRMLAKIGAGGMAILWKAYHVSLDRVVAIKVLRPEFAADPEEVTRFLNEARAAARLRHAHIVQVSDAGCENGVYYIVMEFVAGQSLGQRLRSQGALPVKRALHIVEYVAQALEYAGKEHGIVHRDIKPDNILLTENDQVKLTDLGLAKVLHPRRPDDSVSDMAEGTPNYMAPEQVNGLAADCRSDIYALGTTLYHMLTGRVPFGEYSADEAMRAQVEETLPNPRDLNPRLPTGVVQLLTRMLMKQPSDRPAGWPEVLRILPLVAAGRSLPSQAGSSAKSTIAAPLKAVSQASANSAKVDIPLSPATRPMNLGRALRRLVLTLIWVGFAFWMLLPWVRRLPSTVPDDHMTGLEAPLAVPADPAQEPSQVTAGLPAGPPRSKTPDTPPAAAGQPATRLPGGDLRITEKLSEVAHDVVFHLMRSQVRNAAAIVSRTRAEAGAAEIADALDEIEDMIRTVGRMNDRIRNNFHDMAGQSVNMLRGDREVTVLIGAVSDKGVELREAGGVHRSEVVLFDQLPARERIRWVDPPENPSNALIHTLLLLEAGDTAAAADMAKRSGVLADELSRVAGLP